MNTNRPRGLSFVQKLRKQSIKHHVDPTDLRQGAGAGIVTPPAKPTLAEDLARIQASDPEHILREIKSLRAEAKDHRVDGQQAKAELAEARIQILEKDQKIKEMETAKAAEEQQKLIENQRWKEAYENAEKEKATLISNKDKSLIETATRVKALELGIDVDFISLLDLNGVSVDAAGKVTGLDGAFGRLQDKHAKVLEYARIAKAAAANPNPGEQGANSGQQQGQQQQQSTESNNPADKMFIPGTNMTYGDYAKQLNMVNGAGKPPAESNSGNKKPTAKPDFKALGRKGTRIGTTTGRRRSFKQVLAP